MFSLIFNKNRGWNLYRSCLYLESHEVAFHNFHFHEQFYINIDHVKVLYKCKTPIAMEVWDLNKDQLFQQSVNFNSDNLPRAEWLNLWQGFKCFGSAQTETSGEIEKCPNVQVRYQCIDGSVDLQGSVLNLQNGQRIFFLNICKVLFLLQ